ncbi:putative BZIP domain-containing protein [Seiridium unicorne]|uniref:BZIP domain-containing protein n=1 Tax=Seiridium unicorne TaxID=138068 RepID=A0ABR2V2B6_9PEZI
MAVAAEPAHDAGENSEFGMEDQDRPSFEDFWKRSKEAHQARNVTFLPTSGVESPHNEVTDNAKTRAQARRAQVRKAQKQHRQRKANYTKELEMDIARLRDMIEQTETEANALRTENDGMRRRLSKNAVASGMIALSAPVPRPVQPASTFSPYMLPADPSPKVESTPGADEPEYILRMDMSDTMQTPTFRVSRSPSPSLGTRTEDMFSPTVSEVEMTPIMAVATTTTSTFSASSGAVSGAVSGGLTEEQTELVINFILSLEHICWNHFDPSHYKHLSYDPMDPENGHALMASSIALQHATPDIFTRIDAVNSVIKSNPHCNPDTHDIEWQLSGLSLETLYGLAQTLNPPDRELAPVQAWFEIVQMYGPDVALDRQIIEGLTRGFRGMVRCLQFGAVIQREVFDNIVSNVVRTRFEGLTLGTSVGTGMSLAPPIEDDERFEEVT